MKQPLEDKNHNGKDVYPASHESVNDHELLYQLDGRPSLKAAIPIGLQHVFAMFMGNLAPLLIVIGVVGGISDHDKNIMIQCAMFMSGVATFIQVNPIQIGKFRLGSGLPVVMGTSFAFVPALQSVGSVYGIPGILGSALAGGIVGVIMGIFIKQLKQLFPPVVIGSVLVAIGLNLIPTGIRYMAGGSNINAPDFGCPQYLAVGFLVFIVITVISRFGKGMLKNLGILIGIAIGYLVSIPLDMVNFAPVLEAKWFAFPTPFVIPMEFHLDAVIRFAPIFIIVGLETMGNMAGITNATMDRPLSTKEASGGIIANALTSMMGSCFGVFPNSAFGQNAGLVSLSKIINRFCITVAAIIMLLVSFMPKIGALFSSMPYPVLGGAVITVFSIILINGLKLIAKDGIDAAKTNILAITFGLGYGMGQVTNASAHMPEVLKFIFHDSTTAVCIVGILANLIFSTDSGKSKQK